MFFDRTGVGVVSPDANSDNKLTYANQDRNTFGDLVSCYLIDYIHGSFNEKYKVGTAWLEMCHHDTSAWFGLGLSSQCNLVM